MRGREVARWLAILAANRLINVAWDGDAWRNTGEGGTTHGGAEFSTSMGRLALATENVPEFPREVARSVVLGQWAWRRGDPASGVNAGLLADREPTPTGGNGARARTCEQEAALLEGAALDWMLTTSDRVPVFVELCAGLASVSLMLQGGKHARPPVSRMGNKHGYSLALLRVMGLRPGQGAEHYLWCEPDAGCRALLHAYTDREVMQEAAAIIRGWKDEDPRALWERLRAEGPIRLAESREVARKVLLWRWSFSQRGPGGEHHEGAGYGGPGSKCGDFVGRDESLGCDRTARNALRIPTLLPATVHPDARTVEPPSLPPGVVAYIDPPYVGTTGYGNDLPRAEVIELARRWADAGAKVYISEAEPLPALMADGWFSVEITSQRIGQKRTFSKQQREWVTCSHEPAWRPAEQVALF